MDEKLDRIIELLEAQLGVLTDLAETQSLLITALGEVDQGSEGPLTDLNGNLIDD